MQVEPVVGVVGWQCFQRRGIALVDSAIAAAHGLEGHREVYDVLDGVWGVPASIAPGIVGLVLALPLAMTTLWRAGLARWWGSAAAVAAMAAFLVSGVTWPGAAVATVCLGVVSLALARATDPARSDV